MWMKIIWWNGPHDIKATKLEESRPTVEMQKCMASNRYRFLRTSILDTMDIHNFNMDIGNSAMYIYNYGYPDLHCGKIIMDILGWIMDVNN